jgi:hypothetical protein
MSFLVCSSCQGFMPAQAYQCPHCDEVSIKKPNRLMKNAVLALTSVSVSVTLSACYGMPCSTYVTADGQTHNNCGISTCVSTKEDSLRTGYPICRDWEIAPNDFIRSDMYAEGNHIGGQYLFEDQRISLSDQEISSSIDQGNVNIDQGMPVNLDQGMPVNLDQGMPVNLDQGVDK